MKKPKQRRKTSRGPTLKTRVDAFEHVLRRIEFAVTRIERSVERQAQAIAREIQKVKETIPGVGEVAGVATAKAIERLIARGASK